MWDDRPRSQTSVRNSKATVMIATISAALYRGTRKGNGPTRPLGNVPAPVIEARRKGLPRAVRSLRTIWVDEKNERVVAGSRHPAAEKSRC